MDHNHSDFDRFVKPKTCPACEKIIAGYVISKIHNDDLIFLYESLDREFRSIKEQGIAEDLLLDIQKQRDYNGQSDPKEFSVSWQEWLALPLVIRRRIFKEAKGSVHPSPLHSYMIFRLH